MCAFDAASASHGSAARWSCWDTRRPARPAGSRDDSHPRRHPCRAGTRRRSVGPGTRIEAACSTCGHTSPARRRRQGQTGRSRRALEGRARHRAGRTRAGPGSGAHAMRVGRAGRAVGRRRVLAGPAGRLDLAAASVVALAPPPGVAPPARRARGCGQPVARSGACAPGRRRPRRQQRRRLRVRQGGGSPQREPLSLPATGTSG